MAKDNAQLQRDKRAKEKALLERIGAEKRSLIVSKALDDALHVLGERHSFEEWQETVSTMILNLAAAPAEESARFASMSRPKIAIKEKWSRQLEAFVKTSTKSPPLTYESSSLNQSDKDKQSPLSAPAFSH